MSKRQARKRQKRKQIERILARDGHRCGIHWKGCGRAIEDRATVDHIIPKAYFSTRPEVERKLFLRDWNCQPMHRDCNQDKVGQMTSYPVFGCRCHYTHIANDENMYVYYLNGHGYEKYLLLPDIVNEQGIYKLMLKNVTMPGGKTGSAFSRGYTTETGAQIGPFGHMIPHTPANQVDITNLTLLIRIVDSRVGVAIPPIPEIKAFVTNLKTMCRSEAGFDDLIYAASQRIAWGC